MGDVDPRLADAEEEYTNKLINEAHVFGLENMIVILEDLVENLGQIVTGRLRSGQLDDFRVFSSAAADVNYAVSDAIGSLTYMTLLVKQG